VAQFGAIILGEPVIGKVEAEPGRGWSYFRVHFRIWPGQGGLIESIFWQEAVRAMKALDPTYADWQVPATNRAAAAPKKCRCPVQRLRRNPRAEAAVLRLAGPVSRSDRVYLDDYFNRLRCAANPNTTAPRNAA